MLYSNVLKPVRTYTSGQEKKMNIKCIFSAWLQTELRYSFIFCISHTFQTFETRTSLAEIFSDLQYTVIVASILYTLIANRNITHAKISNFQVSNVDSLTIDKSNWHGLTLCFLALYLNFNSTCICRWWYTQK